MERCQAERKRLNLEASVAESALKYKGDQEGVLHRPFSIVLGSLSDTELQQFIYHFDYSLCALLTSVDLGAWAN